MESDKVRPGRPSKYGVAMSKAERQKEWRQRQKARTAYLKKMHLKEVRVIVEEQQWKTLDRMAALSRLLPFEDRCGLHTPELLSNVVSPIIKEFCERIEDVLNKHCDYIIALEATFKKKKNLTEKQFKNHMLLEHNSGGYVYNAPGVAAGGSVREAMGFYEAMIDELESVIFTAEAKDDL